MGKVNVGNKNNRKLLKIARANGARVVAGKKHILIYDGKFLVAGLSLGSKGADVEKNVLLKFKKRGWKW